MIALLSGKSVTDAARDAGISRRTGYRWRERETFQQRFRAAKDELFDSAVAALHSNALAFVTTLSTVAADPQARPGERVQASREGLHALYKGLEIFDLTARVAALEKTTNAPTQSYGVQPEDKHGV